MILSSISSFLVLSVILSFSASSPLTLGCSILFLTLFLSCLMSFFSFSWFSLLLFLIYVGGLLVMFAYFVAISPNQLHSFSVVSSSLPLLFLAFSTLLLFPVSFIPSNLTFVTTPSIPVLFSTENSPALIFAAITLFLTLLAVVKIAALPSGPLRPFLKSPNL